MPISNRKIKTRLDKIFKDAATSAHRKMSTLDFSTEVSTRESIERQSAEFGREFARVASPPMADLIEEVLTEDMLITGQGLSAPNGPVSGKAIIK